MRYCYKWIPMLMTLIGKLFLFFPFLFLKAKNKWKTKMMIERPTSTHQVIEERIAEWKSEKRLDDLLSYCTSGKTTIDDCYQLKIEKKRERNKRTVTHTSLYEFFWFIFEKRTRFIRYAMKYNVFGQKTWRCLETSLNWKEEGSSIRNNQGNIWLSSWIHIQFSFLTSIHLCCLQDVTCFLKKVSSWRDIRRMTRRVTHSPGIWIQAMNKELEVAEKTLDAI